MQASSRYMRVFIVVALAVLLIVAVIIGVILFTSNDQNSNSASQTSDAFIELINQNDPRASYEYLSDPEMTYSSWVAWVSTINDADVEIRDSMSSELVAETPPQHKITYDTSSNELIVVTVSSFDDGWTIGNIRVESK